MQEGLPLILMQVLVGLKKSNFLHGKTLYPEISDLGNTVIHTCWHVFMYISICSDGGPSGTLLKEQDSSNLVQNKGHKGPVLRRRCIGPSRAQTQILFYSSSSVCSHG